MNERPMVYIIRKKKSVCREPSQMASTHASNEVSNSRSNVLLCLWRKNGLPLCTSLCGIERRCWTNEDGWLRIQ